MIDHHVDKLIEYSKTDDADIHIIVLMMKAITSMSEEDWINSSQEKVDLFVRFTETVYSLAQEAKKDAR